MFLESGEYIGMNLIDGTKGVDVEANALGICFGCRNSCFIGCSYCGFACQVSCQTSGKSY